MPDAEQNNLSELEGGPKEEIKPLTRVVPPTHYAANAHLTPEGYLWVLAPWLLILRSRLSYTMLEMVVLAIAFSATLGAILTACRSCSLPVWFTVGLLLALLQVHLILFAWPLYYLRTGGPKDAHKRHLRLLFILFSQGLFASAWVGVCLLSLDRWPTSL